MTCIVSFPGQHLPRRDTKKRLREVLASSPALAHRVIITDPSFVRPREFSAAEMTVGQTEFVTNHPRRTWFAKITRTADGFRVE